MFRAVAQNSTYLPFWVLILGIFHLFCWFVEEFPNLTRGHYVANPRLMVRMLHVAHVEVTGDVIEPLHVVRLDDKGLLHPEFGYKDRPSCPYSVFSSRPPRCVARQ